MFVYHYHAITQVESGNIKYIDGIAVVETEIDSYGEYMHLKSTIAQDIMVSADRITICSLTLLKSGA